MGLRDGVNRNGPRAVVRVLAVLSMFGCASTDRIVDDERVSSAFPDIEGLDEETWETLRTLSPEVLPGVPEDPTNEVADSPLARLLGQKLFFDAGFSGQLLESDNDGSHGGVGMQGDTGKVSCASCHEPDRGFSDFRTNDPRISLAAGWTKRRSPSLLDVGHATLLMWDGRFDSLQRQALAVFESPREANSSRLFVAQEIARRYAEEYEGVFGDDPREVIDETYPTLPIELTGCQMPLGSTTSPDDQCTGGELHGVPGDGAEYDGMTPAQQDRVTQIALNAGRAIGAYERLLSCGTTRFDLFVAGNENALTDSEKRGAVLFAGKGQCVTCHSGPFMSDQQFHNVGVRPEIIPGIGDAGFDDPGAETGLAQLIVDPLNSNADSDSAADGRVPSSVPPEALGAFRTPMLRCVQDRPSYMHAGNLRTLEDVVAFFSRGGDGGLDDAGIVGQSEIEPLNLSDQERRDLVAFLRSLSGLNPLDPELLQPLPRME